MAKDEKEYKDVYWTSIKEYDNGLRKTIKKEVFEGLGGALKRYEEWILESEGVHDKKLLVDILFIHEGQFFTIREHHCWDRHECEVTEDTLRVEW